MKTFCVCLILGSKKYNVALIIRYQTLLYIATYINNINIQKKNVSTQYFLPTLQYNSGSQREETVYNYPASSL